MFIAEINHFFIARQLYSFNERPLSEIVNVFDMKYNYFLYKIDFLMIILEYVYVKSPAQLF
jgi:hypothetical protein